MGEDEFTAKTHFRTKRIGTNKIVRPANTNTYAAGDVISNITDNHHFTFNDVARGEYYSGSIDSAICHSSTVETLLPDLELWLFSKDIAKVADNSAFGIVDEDMDALVGVVDFNVIDWKQGLAGASGTGNAMCYVPGLQIPFVTNDSLKLFGQLVVRNAYAPISGEVFKVFLTVSRD